jgi:hypothetical protein
MPRCVLTSGGGKGFVHAAVCVFGQEQDQMVAGTGAADVKQ